MEETLTLTQKELEEMFSKHTEEVLNKTKELIDEKKDENPYITAGKFFKELHSTLRPQKALATSTVSVIVPEVVQAKIYEMIETLGQARKLFDKFPMGRANTVKLPKETGYGSASIVDEASQIAATDPTLSYITLTAKKIGRIVKVTNELLEDAVVDVGEYVIKSAAKSIAKLEDTQFFNGDGTGSNFLGLFNASNFGHTQSVTGSIASITYDDLISTKYGLDQAKLEGAVWMMHRNTYAALKQLNDTTGRPLFEDTRAGLELLGYPVVLAEQAPYDAGVVIVFGNPSSSIIGVKKEVTVEYLGELYAENDMVGYKFVERVAFSPGFTENYAVISVTA